MPNLFTFRGYVIYFWTADGVEPIHVHVALGAPSPLSAKYWLTADGKAVLASNDIRLSSKDMRQIQAAIEDHYDYICQKWRDTFEEEPDYYQDH